MRLKEPKLNQALLKEISAFGAAAMAPANSPSWAAMILAVKAAARRIQMA